MLFVSNCVFAETGLQTLQNISAELVKIRQQIESLHNQISFKKTSYKDRMRSYASQKSDLNVRISRAELNIKDLQRELKKLSLVNKEKNKAQKIINPILRVAIAQLRDSISSALPFKLNQRLQALDEIEQRLNNNTISPNKAANHLWAFVEDELLLGRSSGIYNDTLKIGNQQQLVKVLRMGKIAMFYKTQDGQYGVVKKQGSTWQQFVISSPTSTTQLAHLFDSFNKNIRTGQFTLPNPLPKS